MQDTQMLNGHLQNLCLFEFLRSLFLERLRHKTTQFDEAVVDTVTTAFFDYLKHCKMHFLPTFSVFICPLSISLFLSPPELIQRTTPHIIFAAHSFVDF